MAVVWALFAFCEEVVRKHFTVEYEVDEELETKIPTMVVYSDRSIDDVKLALEGGSAEKLSREDRFRLAAKWRELGDVERANFIMDTIWQEEYDETGAVWGNNPFGMDPSKFSEGFFGERYKDQGRPDFMPPKHVVDDDVYGYGCCL